MGAGVKAHMGLMHDPCAAIGDYAIIGDCRTAALISRQGSLEWLCLPHFSSPALFGSLLDKDAPDFQPAKSSTNNRGGEFRISPLLAAQSTRRYLPDTNVLETTFRTTQGVVRIVDSMPIPCGPQLQPMREVLRLIEGVEGTVLMQLEIDPQPNYGRITPQLQSHGKNGWTWTWGDEWLHLCAQIVLRRAGTRLVGQVGIAAGQRLWCSLAYAKRDIGVMAALGAAAQDRLDSTTRWWQSWSARSRYDGPYREAVIRSALTLKLLTFTLSGAVVAAPSTSLPETIGGDRNWDYRYCWLRDAALTMRAFTRLGYLDEARGFLDWLLHATRLTWPELQVLYDVYGNAHVPEEELTHWRGFCGSRPVRIGNGAYQQIQLDVYGAVCAAARELIETTGSLERDEARLLSGFGETVCRLWEQPDHGIWEIRGEPRHYTFSKVMCWTALDALVALDCRGFLAVPRRFEAARAALREQIEARGYNHAIRSYVGVLDGKTLDASLLLMGCLGYLDPGHDRMRATFSRIHERLSCNGLLFRYERGQDRMTAPEGAFGICSFWAIDNLAKRGDRQEARRSFEHLLSFANDVGLFAEEIDADSGALLGNFPQAYTHVGLINAALAIEHRV